MIDWESKLQTWCDKIGASHAGFSTFSTPVTWPFYEAWLEKGYSGEMEYLKTHAETKKNPQNWKPSIRSALVVAFPYKDHPYPKETFRNTRKALYAQGFDYHYWIKQKLQVVVEELQEIYPNEVFETHTDSSPLLERDFAQRAGLGWYGKNTCLIHPKKGSLFLIGEILTSLKVESKLEPIPDFCGKCQKCLEACPTNAIQAPRILDAEKCISYLTIESKKLPPDNLRKKMGDWFFGCDICQTVCPWNQKIFKNELQVSEQLDLSDQEIQNLEAELKFILESSHHQILKKVKGTPLYRAGAKGLKRNALVVVGNRKLRNLKAEVEKLVADPFLKELAIWTLSELS